MIYSAPVLVTFHGDAFRDGAVRVQDRRIVDAGKREVLRRKYPSEEERHFEEAALMPGLINGHTHLEDGFFRHRLPYAAHYASFREVYREKKFGLSAEEGMDAVHLGVLESLKNGTTTLLDMSGTGASFHVLFNERIRSVIFLEFQHDAGEPDGSVFSRTLLKAEGFMANELSNWGVALHPSAAAGADLIRQCASYAREQNVFTLCHAPGSSGGWSGECPLPERAMVVYGGLENEEDLKALAMSRATVVICPRSFMRFREGAFPLKRLLESGVNVCLGTESLALSDSLDMFEEMYALTRLVPGLSSRTVLSLAIHGGARAMGLQGVLGQIRPGFLADLIGVRCATLDPDFICDALVMEEVEVRFVMVNGREVLS
jgi:5-methylthioadenosine/S-adenosylhomocysteine deaminase